MSQVLYPESLVTLHAMVSGDWELEEQHFVSDQSCHISGVIFTALISWSAQRRLFM